jgi:hypothetical protein
MTNKLIAIAGAAVLMAGAAFGQAKSGACDPGCLEGLVDRYIDALIAHDPKALPVTARMKMTENGQRLDPGDGFWRTAIGKGTYRIFVTDPQAGEVAFMGTMREAPPPAAPIPVVVAIRLKVENRQISEIETFVVRNTQAAASLERMGATNPIFSEAIPAAERASRADLIRIANMYYTGLEKNDGKGNYPFTDDCNRIENGVQTTNNPNYRTSSMFAAAAPAGRGGRGGKGKQAPPPPPEPVNPAAMGCKAGFETGYFHFVTRVRDRRFVAVDPEHGLVFSYVFYDYASGKAQNVTLSDGRTITAGPKRPWSFEVAQVFRIEKSKIREVEAILEQVPYGMQSGWSTWEEGMSSRAR